MFFVFFGGHSQGNLAKVRYQLRSACKYVYNGKAAPEFRRTSPKSEATLLLVFVCVGRCVNVFESLVLLILNASLVSLEAVFLGVFVLAAATRGQALGVPY